MTATTTKSKVSRTRSKPDRRCRLESFLGCRLLTVTETTARTRTVTSYHLAEVPTEIGGRAFTVQKTFTDGGDGTVYAVLVDGPNSSCECKGWLRWNHCRHVESLQALITANRL